MTDSARQPEFILASASPRRLQLLKQIGIVPNKVEPADIDETPLKAEKPKEYSVRIAIGKNNKVSAVYPNSIILSADTIVAVGSRILGKPQNEIEAYKFLELLSGRQHRVYTSIVVSYAGRSSIRTICTIVKFKRMSESEMKFHTASNQWIDKSGGYMIQGLASCFIKRINGSVTNVIGLPLTETLNLLRSVGIIQSLDSII